MRKQIMIWVLAVGMLSGLAACGNLQPQVSGDAVVSGNAVSGQGIRDMTKEEKKRKPKKALLNFSSKRENVTVPLQSPEKGQWEVIYQNRDQWYEKGSQYAVTDLDQDGYMEVLITRPENPQPSWRIYEVAEGENRIVKWQTPEVGLSFTENPMGAYYDEKNQIWHLDVAGSEEVSREISESVRYDLALEDNIVHAEKYEEKGQRYAGMKKRYMSFYQYDMEVREDILAEYDDYDFRVEESLELSKWEEEVSADERKQLRLLAKKIDSYRPVWDASCFWGPMNGCAVTDLDEDGELECLVETTIGSGIIRIYYSCLEQSENGMELTLAAGSQRPEDMENMLGLVLGGIGEVLDTWQDSGTGRIYYTFSGADNYGKDRKDYQMCLWNHCFSIEERQRDWNWQGMKKYKTNLRWTSYYLAGYEDYNYEELLVSWLGFGK